MRRVQNPILQMKLSKREQAERQLRRQVMWWWLGAATVALLVLFFGDWLTTQSFHLI